MQAMVLHAPESIFGNPLTTETTLFPLKEVNRALQQLRKGDINRTGVLKIPSY